jgi:DNA repair exonuclease SbcCD ATPase subunit
MAKDKADPATTALVAAAEAFDASLHRFGALAESAARVALDSQKGLERAGGLLKEIAACEEDLQTHAQALMTALGSARDVQQKQAEAVRARALQIQERTEDYGAVMRRFETLGRDAAALNAQAQALAARRKTPDEMVKDGELLAGLDELQERMSAVVGSAETLADDARTADFEDLASKIDSLRQQIVSAQNKIGLLKEALVRAAPARRPS